MVKELGMCWQCGITTGLTKHHVIPKRLQPKVNMIVPLCRPCHDKVHPPKEEHKKLLKKDMTRINKMFSDAQANLNAIMKKYQVKP